MKPILKQSKGGKKKVVKAWWIRNGNEGFLISNIYMNEANAELVCKGRNLPANNNTIKEHKVIPVEIHYKLTPSRKDE